MIFIGDVAIAPGDKFCHLGFPNTFFQHPICLNFEGSVTSRDAIPDWGVVNSLNWAKSFEDMKIGPIFLGNNHIHDLPGGFECTLKYLNLHGFETFGAGVSEQSAEKSVICSSHGSEYVLIGFGWHVIGCNIASGGNSGVNSIEGRHVRHCSERVLKAHPGKRIVAVMHWNYEFERYPQPAHRKLAMELIDMGVHAVIGHHPHIVGPVESYRGHVIAYSLGNWAFSYGHFFGKKLKFHESSFHQIALQFEGSTVTVHHARFSPPSTVAYQFSEDVDSPGFSLQPEFKGFSHQEYLQWFKNNRLKRKGLPSYKEPDASINNSLRDRLVQFRQFIIDLSVKAGLKAMSRTLKK